MQQPVAINENAYQSHATSYPNGKGLRNQKPGLPSAGRRAALSSALRSKARH
jgi:hypothetical protein